MTPMTVLRTVARPLLASMFLVGGVNSLRYSTAISPAAEPVADLVESATQTRVSPETLVKVNAVTHVVAGAALATGRFPRTAGLVLAATLVPTTAVGHPFWNETDPEAKQNQQIHFFKNLSMMGGLLMSTLDPDPHKKFIAVRAKNRAVDAKDKVAGEIDSLLS